MLPSLFTVGLDQEGPFLVIIPSRQCWLTACKVLLCMPDKARQSWLRLDARRAQALAHPYLAQLHDASSEPAAPSAHGDS